MLERHLQLITETHFYFDTEIILYFERQLYQNLHFDDFNSREIEILSLNRTKITFKSFNLKEDLWTYLCLNCLYQENIVNINFYTNQRSLVPEEIFRDLKKQSKVSLINFYEPAPYPILKISQVQKDQYAKLHSFGKSSKDINTYSTYLFFANFRLVPSS